MSVVGVILLHEPDILCSVKVLARVFPLGLLLAGTNVGDGLESMAGKHFPHLGVIGKVEDSEKCINVRPRIAKGDAGEFF